MPLLNDTRTLSSGNSMDILTMMKSESTKTTAQAPSTMLPSLHLQLLHTVIITLHSESSKWTQPRCFQWITSNTAWTSLSSTIFLIKMHPRFILILPIISILNTDSLTCRNWRISKHLLHKSKLIFPHSRLTCSIWMQELTAKNTLKYQLLHTVDLTQHLSWLVSVRENTLLE